MASAVDFDRIVRKFADIIGQPGDETYRLIERLSEQRGLENLSRTETNSNLAKSLGMNKHGTSIDPELKKKPFLYFTGSAMLLEPIDIDSAGTTVRSRGASINSVKKIGKGGYGIIFGSTTGKNNVYKQFTFKKDDGLGLLGFEDKLRDMYIETFIQTVLASVPDVGQYVCMPKKMYRSATLRGLETDRSARLGYKTPNKIVVYLVMEPLQYTFESLLVNKYSRHIDTKWFGPLMFELGYTLSVLKDRYGFNHGDLHANNIMFDATGKLKLIDFGFSCLTINGRVFKQLNKEAIGCFQGYDLAIFFYNLWYAYIRTSSFVKVLGSHPPTTVRIHIQIDDHVTKFFKSTFFTTGPFNLFSYGMKYDENGGETGHWLFYNDVEGSLRDTKKNNQLLEWLKQVKILNPRFLMEHFSKYHTGPIRHTHPVAPAAATSAATASASPKASNYFIPALHYPGLIREKPPLYPKPLESPEFSPTFALSPNSNTVGGSSRYRYRSNKTRKHRQH